MDDIVVRTIAKSDQIKASTASLVGQLGVEDVIRRVALYGKAANDHTNDADARLTASLARNMLYMGLASFMQAVEEAKELGS